MFANFLIGLREGLEAALVVGILVAYLVKSGRRDSLGPVWLGVAVAVGMSLGVGAILTFTSNSLDFTAQETFAGVMSLIAVGFVTWMIFWMRRQSRHLRDELQGKLDDALTHGALALGLMAFLAVGREGLETALFLWPALRSAGSGAGPGIGAVVGLGTAVVLGYLVYQRSIHLDLAKFFRITGGALIVVAAGVLAYGLHDLQEADVLPGLGSVAFDISRQIPPSSWYGTLLKGVFNLSPVTTWLQAVAWIAYVVPVTYLFFRPAPTAPAAVATSASTPVSASAP
ncbi:MAG: High-affinity iron transporter [Acidimicrobiales bacterium]|nr:High-affinity iron transporter [Acidimicrobiales bacterium]